MAGPKDSKSSTKGCRPWKLELWCTIAVVAFQVTILSTITALTVISELSDGFATITNKPLSSFGRVVVPQQLLWTSLPVLVLSLSNIAYAMIVNSAAERQPYEELVDKPKRSNADVTILLDYASYPPLYGWAMAFGNKHPHLGVAMFVLLVCSVSVVPLTAGLFRAAGTQRIRQISLQKLNEINSGDLGVQTDLQSAVDLAAAIRTYDAAPLTWMTSRYAFDPFVTADIPGVGNLTATTSAYYVKPQCQVIDVAPSSLFGNNATSGSTSLQFVDRDCNVTTEEWPITAAKQSFTYTWFEQCSDSSLPLDRVGVFGGIYSSAAANHLTNVTVISCLPEYFNETVTLTMAFSSEGAQRVIDTSEGPSTQMRLINFRAINSNLPFGRQSGLSGSFVADVFGNAVHSYAAALSPASEFRIEVYLRATEEVYTTMFAALASTQLMQARSTVLNFEGHQGVASTHLYASVPVAAVICTLLCSMIACTLVLIVHVERSSVILTEEPVGLLGRALLLLRSEVTGFAAKLEKQHPAGQRIDHVKQNCSVIGSECYLAGQPGSGAEGILLGGLEEIEPEYKVRPLWKRLFTKTPARRSRKQPILVRQEAQPAQKPLLSGAK